MSVWSKMTNFFALRDVEDDEDAMLDSDVRPHVVPLHDAKSARKVGVSVFHPRRFEDVSEIADNLRSRLLVVVNLIGADRSLSQRMVDFLSGVVFTLDGKMQKLAENIYLFAPSNVQVQAKEYDSARASAYEAY